MSDSIPTFDIIFAGGGTAACLIAGRLADADPNLQILIVEGGPHTENDLAFIQPARYLTHLNPGSTTVNFMVANPERELDGRQTVVPVGACVGGGSSINFMVYTRAAASDYDEWQETYNNPGWGSKALIPLLKKTETYQCAPGQNAVHGYSGPLKVSYGGIFTNVGKDFLAVGQEYDPKHILEDPNDLYHVNGYGHWQKWISEDGRRSDVPHNLIYNKKHSNITILAEHLVKRVIFEGTRAVGIEYVQNPRFHPTATSIGALTAHARKLVVLSAGAFGSPVILERSGIGAKKVLEKYGVKQLVDLPGVGENYQDHQVIFTPYLASENAETIDAIVRHEQPAFDEYNEEWLRTGKGLMASNALDAGIKLRFNSEELKVIGPAFTKKWDSYYASRKDSPTLWLGALSVFVGDYSSTPSRKYFTVGFYVQHPSSIGFVHMRSGTDATVPPEFETGYLKEKDDLELLIYGYKRAREYARRMAFYRGEYTPNHPHFPKGSPVHCREHDGPVPIDAPDLVYTKEDERIIEDYTRKTVGTSWHSLGTCAMKDREDRGVVDSKLNVYGVSNLKVADLSIAPSNVAANTYSTALVIAEKAALIVAEELGIEGV